MLSFCSSVKWKLFSLDWIWNSSRMRFAGQQKKGGNRSTVNISGEISTIWPCSCVYTYITLYVRMCGYFWQCVSVILRISAVALIRPSAGTWPNPFRSAWLQLTLNLPHILAGSLGESCLYCPPTLHFLFSPF